MVVGKIQILVGVRKSHFYGGFFINEGGNKLVDSGHKKSSDGRDDFLCSDEIIISVKEARKILGKKVSSQISDEDIMRTILAMSNLANHLLDFDFGSKN